MTNRIGNYTGKIEDLGRARDMLGFCESILRISEGKICASEFAALSRIQREAAIVLRNFNLELPEERPH